MEQPALQDKLNNSDHDLHLENKIREDFYNFLKINEEEEHHDEEEDEEEEFSFICGGEEASAIDAEEAFTNGQIKTVFPLFNRDLLFSDAGDFENLPMSPPVKKVFVETEGDNGRMSSSTAGNDDEIVGPYCEWSSRKAVDTSPEVCKKSNSTGFSKIWRFKEFRDRCNSDGRDTFVFLNNAHAPPPPKPKAAVEAEKTVKVKRVSGKGKTVSSHEVYLRSKAKEDDRRRSYLPYRPELMGFFTNVNTGLTRNVHPF